MTVFLTAFWPDAAFAQAPRTLSISGVLANAAGTPKPNGSYNLTFRLYDAPNEGAALWTEANKPVTVTGGKGAFFNDAPLSPRPTESLSRAVLVTGFPYDRTEPLERQLRTLSAFLRYPIQDVRRDELKQLGQIAIQFSVAPNRAGERQHRPLQLL